MTRLINAPTRKLALACAAWNTGEDAFQLLHSALVNTGINRDRKSSGFNKILDQGFSNFLRTCEIDLAHIDNLYSSRDLYRWAVAEIKMTRDKCLVKRDQYMITIKNDTHRIDIDKTSGLIYSMGKVRTEGPRPQYLVDVFKMIAAGYQVLYAQSDIQELSHDKSA